MEKLKVKHDHKLTDIVKVCLFSLFLILPILLFLPNCLYYGFNEHATNSETTTINYKYQSNEVNSVSDYIVGNIYQLNCEQLSIEDMLQSDNDILFKLLTPLTIDNDYLSIDESLRSFNTFTPNTFLRLINSTDTYYIETYYSYEQYSDYEYTVSYLYDGLFLDNCIVQFFEGTFTSTFMSYTDYNVIESVEINTNDTISNKIERSWESLWQTPMLNWTNNNTFAFTIKAFTNVFAISQESYLTNYLNYILTLTCVYLIFDIVIVLFTKLTHMITCARD